MPKFLIFTLLVMISFNVFSTKPIAASINKLKIMGQLPKPYNSFSLEIETDLRPDKKLKQFSFFRGKRKIEISEQLKYELRDVNVTTLSITHMMHRTLENQEVTVFGDDIYLRFKIGEYYHVSKNINGKNFVKSGQDIAILIIDLEGNVTLSRELVKDTHDGWKLHPQLCSEVKPLSQGWECQ